MNKNLTYHYEGDYLIPDVIPPSDPRIGPWGLRRRDFLMKNRKPIYTGLLLSGKLNGHLEEVDHSAEQMFFQFVEQMSEREGITEKLKAENQMEWVRRREYPTFMEWAEKYPIFLHCLLGELCDDFEEILTQEYEASLLREEMASGEDEDPGDAL